MNISHPTHNIYFYFTSTDYVTLEKDEVFGITDLVAKVLEIDVHQMWPSISLANARATLPLIVPPNKMDNLIALLERLSRKLMDEGKLKNYEIKSVTT